MASIKIAADVDSSEFLELKAKFDEYMVALAKAPAAWRGVGKELADTRNKFEKFAENATAIAATVAVMHESSKNFYEVTTATARQWHTLSLSTASAAKNIAGMTESLLKWTGIVSLITGGAGLFGFDKLAHSVSSQRMAALGTGGDYGARAAFLTNMRRFGDPEGLLSRVATAQTDIEESKKFRVLSPYGFKEGDLKGDPTEVAYKAIEAGIRRATEQNKPGGAPLASDPFLQGFTIDERYRLRDQPQELRDQIAQGRAEQKSKRFAVSGEDQEAYQKFTTQMERASRQIETTFVKGLVKLSDPLKRLSTATVKLVDKFVKTALPALIDDLSGGIEWLSTEMDKPDFIKKVEGIISSIGSLAVSFGNMVIGVAKFLNWLGVSATSDVSGGVGGFSGGNTRAVGGGGATGTGRSGPLTPDQVAGRTTTPRIGGGGGTVGTQSEHEEAIRADAVAAGIDPAYAMRIAKGEGLGTAWGSGIDHGTSFGDFQLHRGGPGSVGYEYEKIYGPMKPQDWRRMNKFALNWAATHGWGAWSSRNKVGVGDRGGLEHAHAVPIEQTSTRKASTVAAPADIGRGWQDAVHKAQKPVSISAIPGGNFSLGSGAAAAGGP